MGLLPVSRLKYKVGQLALLLAVLCADNVLSAQTQASSGTAEQKLPEATTETTPKSELAQREKNLRSYLASHSDSADAHYLLAYTLFREMKAKDSLAEYTQAAALRTPTAKDLQAVALDYVLLDDYTDADHWMSRSVEGQAQNAEAWYDLGRIKYTENRFGEAVQSFERALALSPRSVKTENNMGLALEGLGRMDDAVAAYRQAIAWEQDTAQPGDQREQPLLNLSIVLANRNEFKEALDLAKQADHISPHDAKIKEELGRIYTRLDDLLNAEAALEQAAVLTPDVAAIHYELAQVYKKLGKEDQAKAEFAKTAEINGTRSTPER